MSNNTKPCIAADPQFELGEKVSYRDHTDRPQTGEVIIVEARWNNRKDEPYVMPFILYTVTHPTYRNNRIYLVEADMRKVPHDAR